MRNIYTIWTVNGTIKEDWNGMMGKVVFDDSEHGQERARKGERKTTHVWTRVAWIRTCVTPCFPIHRRTIIERNIISREQSYFLFQAVIVYWTKTRDDQRFEGKSRVEKWKEKEMDIVWTRRKKREKFTFSIFRNNIPLLSLIDRWSRKCATLSWRLISRIGDRLTRTKERKCVHRIYRLATYFLRLLKHRWKRS